MSEAIEIPQAPVRRRRASDPGAAPVLDEALITSPARFFNRDKF